MPTIHVGGYVGAGHESGHPLSSKLVVDARIMTLVSEHVEQADLVRFRQFSEKSQIAHQINYRLAGLASLSQVVPG